MNKQHHYKATIVWTGNTGKGTKSYTSYERSHTISVDGKHNISGSSDPAFRGDKTRYNPEDLLLCSLSACHMLWYLSICAEEGIIVVDYVDNATGTMVETPDGSGHFTSVILNPVVTVAADSMIEKANQLHKEANKMCYIANSMNFPISHNVSAKTLALTA